MFENFNECILSKKYVFYDIRAIMRILINVFCQKKKYFMTSEQLVIQVHLGHEKQKDNNCDRFVFISASYAN